MLTTSAYGDGRATRARTWSAPPTRSAGARGSPARTRSTRCSTRATYSGRPHPLSKVLVPEAAGRRLDAVRALARPAPPSRAPLRLRDHDLAAGVGPRGRLALQRRGVPWVADVRDAWTFESLRPTFPTAPPAPPRRAARATLARRRRRGRLRLRARRRRTCARRGIADPLLIPNGWDPEAAPAAGAATGLLDPERASLVYTGRFGSYGRDPAPAGRGPRRARRSDPDSAAQLELVIAGPLTDEEAELFATDVSPARIVRAGSLERRAGARAAARGRRAAAARPADPLAAAQHQAVRVPRRGAADPRARRGHRGRPGRGSSAARSVPRRRPGGDRRRARAGRRRRARAAGRARRRYTYPAPAEGMAAAVEAAITPRPPAGPAADDRVGDHAVVAGTWSR